MVLLASPLGEGVYRRVGFTNVKDIGVSYRQRLAQPPPTTTTTTAWIPTALEHEDAILLEEEIGGSFRGEFLRMLFEKDHLCAVAKTGSNIAAVAWGRYKGQTPSTGEVNLHVGPVVARTPDLAKSVVAEILRMDAASHSGHSASCSRATVLSMRIRGNETGQRMFQSLGFEKVFDPPYMQKAVADESNSSPSGVDLACADADYYATTWWDMG